MGTSPACTHTHAREELYITVGQRSVLDCFPDMAFYYVDQIHVCFKFKVTSGVPVCFVVRPLKGS
jgi:hypothetical protein